MLGRWHGDQLLLTRVAGKYWMYWGEGILFAATSDDGITWEPVTAPINDHRLLTLGDRGLYQGISMPGAIHALRPLAYPRPGGFDHSLVEPGPAAVLGDAGIVLWYNGSRPGPDAGIYCGGQMLFAADQPTVLIERPAAATLIPDQPWELNGQCGSVTFTEGLVRFRGRQHVYYGGADSRIGVAIEDL